MPVRRYRRLSMLARCSELRTHPLNTRQTDGPMPMFSPQHDTLWLRSFVHMLELWNSVRDDAMRREWCCAMRTTSRFMRSLCTP